MPRRLVRPRHLGECHVHVRRVGDGRSSPTRLCGRILNRPRRVRSTSTPGVPVTGLVALQCCRGRSCRRGCGGRSPVDRELRHIRLSRHRVDRHIVPLWDRGRRGGDAGTECVAGRCSAHRGPRARRPTRTQKVPTRNGVSEPGPRPTARTPARQHAWPSSARPRSGAALRRCGVFAALPVYCKIIAGQWPNCATVNT